MQLFLFVALKQAKNLHQKGQVGDAILQWQKNKKIAMGIFVICTIMHFAAFAWMDPVLVSILLPVCFVVGVVFPIIMCKHGDGQLNAPAPQPAYELPVRGGAQAVQAVPIAGQGYATGTVIAAPHGQVLAPSNVVTGNIVMGTVVDGAPAPVKYGAGAVPAAPLADEPSLAAIADDLRRELGLSGSVIEVVDAACAQLGVPREGGVLDKARACHQIMRG